MGAGKATWPGGSRKEQEKNVGERDHGLCTDIMGAGVKKMSQGSLGDGYSSARVLGLGCTKHTVEMVIHGRSHSSPSLCRPLGVEKRR